MPSPPVGVFASILVGMIYAVIVPGRPRSTAKWAAWGLIAILGLSRMYLAVDHPTDDLAAIILGVGIPVVAFRFFTPNEVFPVTYRRGKTAHLDVGGQRGQAIRHAVRDQLGHLSYSFVARVLGLVIWVGVPPVTGMRMMSPLRSKASEPPSGE